MYVECLTKYEHCATLSTGGEAMAKAFGFRLPDDLRQYLQRKASEQRTTVSHYIVLLILQDMKQEKTEREGKHFGKSKD